MTVEASSPEPSHSRKRKLRLRTEEDWWGTTAKEILDLFSTDNDDRATLTTLRDTLRKGYAAILALRLAGMCGTGFGAFATALAVAIHTATSVRVVAGKTLQFDKSEQEVVRRLATYLETHTRPMNHKWTQHSIPTIEAKMLEFLNWYWLN